MTQTDKEIAQKIKDGSYFKDAREWYARQYLFPATERSFLLLIAIITSFVFFLSINNIKSLSIGSDEPIPVIVKVDNATDYFPIIKPLAKQHENTQAVVTKYLISDYLKTREEYHYSKDISEVLKNNLKKIRRSSAKSVLNEYQSYMSEANKYSPVIRYRDHTSRDVEIKNIVFDNGDPSSGKAVVQFVTITYNKKEKKEDKSLWEANIHFRLPDIETIARTGAPLRFLVKYYKAKPLK